jgi:hypothetical protein
MKLSENTITLLKNFSAINPNMLFKPGKTIQTVSEAKNIMASATIDEEIPQQFGVYDLTEFLATLDLVENPDLVFDEHFLTVKDGRTSVKYYYSAPEVLTTPPRQVTMPNPELTLELSRDTIDKLKRAASVLGHASLEILGNNGQVSLNIVDVKNATANTFSLNLGDDNPCKESFCFILSIGNLKMIPGDYTVSISSKLISHFKNKNQDVQYWLALEKTSYFGVNNKW